MSGTYIYTSTIYIHIHSQQQAKTTSHSKSSLPREAASRLFLTTNGFSCSALKIHYHEFTARTILPTLYSLVQLKTGSWCQVRYTYHTNISTSRHLEELLFTARTFLPTLHRSFRLDSFNSLCVNIYYSLVTELHLVVGVK